MCGFTGFISSPGTGPDDLAGICRAMAGTLAHRGPDDGDVWVDRENGVALGHRRLSILDLSPLGRQPMTSSCGRYVIAYNGEVYNHPQLRSELEAAGDIFTGSSDTETMLAAISRWGLRNAVERFNGMFAFALWDRRERKLHLVRDRIGIKPLYYGTCGQTFLFGSELKALRAHPAFIAEIDRDALTQFFRHNYIPTPFSIYRGIKKLTPGTILTFDPATSKPREERYWDVREAWLKGIESPFPGTEREALEELQSLLADAVSIRTLSDVPVGAFLSGGIDSSTVCAVMQAGSSRPVKSFCLGFDEDRYDESRYARDVAAHLGTEHHEQRLSAQDLMADIPNFPQYWDEPFSDAGQLPAHLISKLAREQVTVCLSGDGGDELFYGYQRYFQANAWKHLSRIPGLARASFRAAGAALGNWLSPAAPGARRSLARLSLLGSRNFSECYRYQVSHSKYPAALVPGGNEPASPHFKQPPQDAHPQHLMPMWDLQGYVPDGVLTKVDRASMAEALEVRVPILDYRVVEFAAAIPLSMKVGPDGGKHLLRQLAYKHIPRDLLHRPKMGFGIPLDVWLKSDLRNWAEDLLDESLIRRQGILDPGQARGTWKAFLNGMPGGEYHVWDLLMFQSWYQKNANTHQATTERQ